MDTSPEYILQCEKAEEIQELMPLHTTGEWQHSLEIEGKDFRFSDGHGKVVWLPRQDQLQEMVGLNQHNIPTILPTLAEFHSRNMYEAIEDEHLTVDKGTRLIDWHQRQFKSIRHFRHVFTSLEQLWLAFVMTERWNKKWDGEDWILE